MICKFLICSMLSCNGCSTGYKIYNQNIRLATLFFISLLPKVCPERPILAIFDRFYQVSVMGMERRGSVLSQIQSPTPGNGE